MSASWRAVGVDVQRGVGEEERAVLEGHQVHGRGVAALVGADDLERVAHGGRVAAVDAGHGAVDVALLEHQQRVPPGAARQVGGVADVHALAAPQLEEPLGQAIEALVAVGIDDLHALQIDADALGRLPDARFVADQHGPRDALFLHLRGGPLGARLLALGEGHAAAHALGLGLDGGHHVVAPAEVLLQGLAVGLHVDLVHAGDAVADRRLGHGGGHVEQHPVVEGLGDEVVGAEAHFLPAVGLDDGVGHLLLGEGGQGACAGNLHALRDGGRAHVECAAEHEREAEHVVDLVRIVAAPRRHDDVVAGGRGLRVADLRVGVGHREHDGPLGHRADHVLVDDAAHGDAEEQVRPDHRVGQRARLGLHGDALLDAPDGVLAPLVDDAVAVGEDHVRGIDPHLHEHVDAGDAGGPRAGADHLELLEVLAGDLAGR